MNEYMMLALLGVLGIAGIVAAFLAFKHDKPSASEKIKPATPDLSKTEPPQKPLEPKSQIQLQEEPSLRMNIEPEEPNTQPDSQHQQESTSSEFQAKSSFPEGTVDIPNASLEDFQMNIGLNIFIAIITCGLYNIFWNYKQMNACNALLQRKEFTFWHWFVFSILTCGIYHVIYQYKMGEAIVETQHIKNKPRKFSNLPIMSCLLTLIGLSIVVDGIHQNEINKLVR